jgi:EAL domain-containing protein (putative c-di-GMP-specific phosphodiesterase class I)
VRNADIAMYDVKRRGTGGYVIFDDTMRQRVVERLALETDLRAAVEQSLIRVKYQPIVDLATGEIRGLEALARWPEGRREVPPVEFIAVAEESGLIRLLGHHVLRTALDDFASSRAQGLVDERVYLSVNISRQQLDDPALPEIILGALTESGVPPEALRLEITESTLMQEPERIRRIVSEVCASGVGLHLDDFGTGYSSLAALHKLPVDALKIDRSFVTSAAEEGGDAIIRAIVALAHSLALEVIAEGIERPEQRMRLLGLGCQYGQGFLFSRPLGAEEMEALLMSWTPPEAAALGIQ